MKECYIYIFRNIYLFYHSYIFIVYCTSNLWICAKKNLYYILSTFVTLQYTEYMVAYGLRIYCMVWNVLAVDCTRPSDKNTSYISTVMTFSYALINIDLKCTLACLCVVLRGDVMDMLCTPPINLSHVANTEGHCCDRAQPDNAEPI